MTKEQTPRLTRRQSAILTLFTGITTEVRGFSAAHELAEELLGRPVWTHEFASPDMAANLKRLARPLLEEIAYDEEKDPNHG